LFSSSYLLATAKVFAKYPSLSFDLVAGKEVSTALQSKKIAEWSKVRFKFEDHPKKTLGFKIYLNPNDMSKVSPSIATVGWINLARTIITSKFLKKGMTFLDVGANIGFYTLLAAKLVGDSGTVVAFEPEDANLSLLRRSVSESNFQNVEIRKQVLSDKVGLVDLYLSPQTNPEAHSLILDHTGETEAAESTTLPVVADSLRDKGRRIDFIKMHVGCENMILRAALEMIQREKPIILMSFIPSQWQDDRNLLEVLYQVYFVYQVVDSPFLTKPTGLKKLLEGSNTETLLLPRS